MATPNAIAVALFNAAAGGYSGQIVADTNSLANAVGLILEKDISNDAQKSIKKIKYSSKITLKMFQKNRRYEYLYSSNLINEF